eukprot:scaffold68857_cov57-Phaeocystis_antarctica.AAC.2
MVTRRCSRWARGRVTTSPKNSKRMASGPTSSPAPTTSISRRQCSTSCCSDGGVRAAPLTELVLLAADPEATAIEESHEAGQREPAHVQRLPAQQLEHPHPLRVRAGADLCVEAGGAAVERVGSAAEELVAHLAAKECGRAAALRQQEQPLELLHLVLLGGRAVLAEHPLHAKHHLGKGGAGGAGGTLSVSSSRAVGLHPGRSV